MLRFASIGCILTKEFFDRPIIILSAPRSGSTLLFETLCNVDNLWTIGDESHAVIEHIPQLSTVARGYKSNALTAEDADEKTITTLKGRFKELLRDRDGVSLTASESKQSIRFLEKTPKNSLRIQFLNKVFPDALFIYLVRDPRANINSIIDAWHSGHFQTYPMLPGFNGRWSLFLTPNWQSLQGKSTAEIATYQWQVANQTILKDLQNLGDDNRWQVINYDQLIDNPESVIKNLCDFIGLETDERLITKLKNGLPLSQYTLSKPSSIKWHQKAHIIKPFMSSLEPLLDKLNSALKGNEQNQITADIDQELVESSKAIAKAAQLETMSKVNAGQSNTYSNANVSRNSPCPCGSGQRFKLCHGKLT